MDTFAAMLKRVKSHRLKSFLYWIKRDIGLLPPFHEYIEGLCAAKGLKRSKVILKADLDPDFGRQVFKNQRRPSRDVVIKLAFGFALNLTETQELLRAAGYAPLDMKGVRDCVIVYQLEHKLNIQSVQNALLENKLPALRGKLNEPEKSEPAD
jgi:hypothetical protein